MHAALLDIHSLSYLGIFLLLTLNGAINIPSSQIIYIAAGALAATHSLTLLPILVMGTLGNTLGNMITFLIVKRYGVVVMKKFLLVPESHLHTFHERVLRQGLPILFLGKLTPSLKVLVPTVAGLAQIKSKSALLIFLGASCVWAALFIGLGYYFGTHITLTKYSIVMGIVGITLAFYFYNRIIKTTQ